MNRAFLVDRRTGEVSQIQVEGDDGVRRYFASSDDIYGKTEKLEDGSVVRVWRTRDKAQHVEVYGGLDRRTLEAADLAELPLSAKTGLEASI